VRGVRRGQLYRYRVDGEGPFPDPASRFQPRGVHGPSQVVDARRFRWSDARWRGLALEALVVYELHVGTFSPEGTFDGVRKRLRHLRDLGVTAVELMPLADFAGMRNWGYDGVCLFAPARCYGTPDDLRRLVDSAHRVGLGVILDVVFNHLGPDGAYHGAFSRRYFSRRHRTPWGAAMNLDGPGAAMVRETFVENALHWAHEYHVDGLRLDATHALIDDGPRHFLAELTSRVRAGAPKRTPPLLIAEDHRNLAHMLRPEAVGGWGLDAVWADDFHHQVRRAVAGDSEGYYADFSGTTADICESVQSGWFFRGQRSKHLGRRRGTDPTGIAPRRFVVCLQNHDQVGNRACGERLHHQIPAAAFRAAAVLLLCAPETPLLFMGQEWAATTPFLYFTDHEPKLGRLVTNGRRREFESFSAFTDPKVRARIPDPQAPETFLASRLDWTEIEREPHASILRLHRALLRLRRTEPALRRADWKGVEARPLDEDCLSLRRRAPGSELLVIVRLRGAGGVAVPPPTRWRRWRLLFSTEDTRVCPDPTPAEASLSRNPPSMRFSRPGAVILKSRAS
jgi:maltooligosyltrehalose trehalohydrolase